MQCGRPSPAGKEDLLLPVKATVCGLPLYLALNIVHLEYQDFRLIPIP
jgi:hypothetical protein